LKDPEVWQDQSTSRRNSHSL